MFPAFLLPPFRSSLPHNAPPLYPVPPPLPHPPSPPSPRTAIPAPILIPSQAGHQQTAAPAHSFSITLRSAVWLWGSQGGGWRRVLLWQPAGVLRALQACCSVPVAETTGSGALHVIKWTHKAEVALLSAGEQRAEYCQLAAAGRQDKR